MQQTAHSMAGQTSRAGGQQRVSNMQAGHGMGACKHKCFNHVLFSKRSQDLPPSPVMPAHTRTNLLGTWAAEASTAPEVAARLPDCLLPLPGRECLLLLPCQDGLTACCHCRCCRAVGRRVHALYVAASCCLLAWGAPAAVRALHITHHHMHILCKRHSPGSGRTTTKLHAHCRLIMLCHTPAWRLAGSCPAQRGWSCATLALVGRHLRCH